ncbi:MAG TPA: CBS domain-containing protein [Acidobacteriaceae bacterium]|nr:CBS domain-containing protein [Acidobacteriaceae bacterium]
MRAWSFPIGRVFGVEVRIHAFFLLLLAMAVVFGAAAGSSTARVLGLWLLLLMAVAVREIVRGIAGVYLGLEMRGLLLLPTGGVTTYASLDSAERAVTPEVERKLTAAGSLANIGFGVLMGGMILASAPGVDLMARPWIAPSHLLRGMVWLNILLGVVNALPVVPLSSGGAARTRYVKGAPGGRDRRQSGAPAAISGFSRVLGSGVGQWLAVGLVLAGLLMANLWLVILGAFVLLGSRMDGAGAMAHEEADQVRMRDIMLTQFSTLSASDTLEDALQRAVHTMQDVFPVVRGATLVGSVSKQNLLEALAASGNSYVQGVMTRSFPTAQPDDSLVKTLRRIMGEQGAQLVPVMEGERIVGIVTPQNLSQSMGLLSQSRRVIQANEDE